MAKSIEEIVKSKQMIGEHSHRARVEIEGLGGISWDNEIEWYTDRPVRADGDGVNKWGGGNFITRADGKILATYNNRRTGEVFLSIVEDETKIFTTDNVLEENEWVFTNIAPRNKGVQFSSLQKLLNGNILLYVLNPGNETGIERSLKVYKSVNGLGTDFTYLTTIRSSNFKSYPPVGENVGQPIELESGRIIIPLYDSANSSTDDYTDYLIGYSDDKGETWAVSMLPHPARGKVATSTRGIANFNGRLVTATANLHDRSYYWFHYSDDEGETWNILPEANKGIGIHASTIFWDGVDTNYWYNHDKRKLYALPDNLDFPTDELAYSTDGSFWQITGISTPPNTRYRALFRTEEGNLAWMGRSTGTQVRLLGGTRKELEPKPTHLPVADITISRTKGMIGSSQVTIENKGGMYAPDGTDNPRVLIPNKKIEIYQGYGDNMHQTFTGLIDSIDMNTFPQLLTIKSRDMLKLAKDQMITYQGHNTITFNNNTVEEIFNRLAGLAGLDLGQVDIPNLTITQKQFTWETYLDAMSWLEELIGYHLYCDNKGLVHFVKDGVPEMVQIAHEFREGEDIVSLSYSIDDDDLYSKVIAFGEEKLSEEEIEEGIEAEVIRVEKDFPAANYWNLPKDKILKIDVRDADTMDKVTRIVDDAIYLMQVRARTVQFECIAVPDLDIGDFITVTEQSSTVSEVYRITGMSSSQDADRYIMNLTCYHHGQQKQ